MLTPSVTRAVSSDKVAFCKSKFRVHRTNSTTLIPDKMKSIIFVAAVCVVAVVALVDAAPENVDAQFEAAMASAKQTINKCTAGMSITEEDLRNAALGKENNIREQVGEMMSCTMNEAGMMDSNELRAEKMCQWVQETFDQEAADAGCQVIQDCASISGEPGDVAVRFTTCVLNGSMAVLRRGIEASA